MKNRNIFLIESHNDIAEIIRLNLATEQIKTFCFDDYKKAIDKYDKNIPDCIVINSNLCKVNNYEFLNNLKSKNFNRNTPVIIIANNNCESDILDALSKGIDDYVTWPFSFNILINRINLSIEKYKIKNT